MHNTKTALILDDHVIIRNSCRSLLEQENFLVVWEGAYGSDALEAYRQLEPAISIIDLSIDGMSGLDTIQKILEYDQTSRIIVFSMHTDSMFISRAFNYGVSGYVTKASQPAELITAVKMVLAGKHYMSKDIDNSELHSQINIKQDLISTLTKQEKNVFIQAVRGSNSTTISKNMKISTKSVSHHLFKVKQKLGAKNIPELIKIAICYGIEINKEVE